MKHKLVSGAVVAALAVAVPAAGGPSAGGQFVPGESMAAVELGMTRADVLDAWGRRHGVCRDCAVETWYFNERPFHPQGVGAVFERGRVVHAFTLWQPEGWATPEGLKLGAPAGEIGATYGELDERSCRGYSALVRDEGDAQSVFYAYEDEVWGFGLVRPARSPCL
ncbi:MAG: hypothetical protein ACRDNE_07205 [Gaiellaceae bacterium]